MTNDHIKVLLQRAGLHLSSVQSEQIAGGWTLIEPMLVRIRVGKPGCINEPAHIFRVDAYTASATDTEKL
ncbi:hypothetical protein ASG35_12740 [Burkholderia sp. Leaf177]|nr:hypothetical protein ASG35_12740 [Burkholderia sp. Leaf177]